MYMIGWRFFSAVLHVIKHDDKRFTFDTYRRLIQMYGDVVMGVSHEKFENAFGWQIPVITVPGTTTMRLASLALPFGKI